MIDLGDLLAVDPGIRSPGAALFRNGVLIAAACVKFPIDTAQNDGTRCLVAAKAICKWALDAAGRCPSAVAFEWPQIYKHDTPSVANSVVPMAGVSMAVVGALHVLNPGILVVSRVPAEIWGQLPKFKKGDVTKSPRALRILSRLSAAERLVMPAQHDVIDAVGIGLKACGRFELHRSLSSV